MPQEQQSPFRTPADVNPFAGAAPGGAPLPNNGQDAFQANMGAWDRFLTKLATDTNFQQSLLTAGTQLLQPRPVGQTQVGAIGEAIQTGQKTYQGLKTGEEQKQFKERQLGLQERQVAVQEAKLPGELAHNKADIARLEALAKRYGSNDPQVSVGSEQSLAQRMAEAKVSLAKKAGREIDPQQAFLDSVDELRTAKQRKKTPAEFKLEIRKVYAPYLALATPEEQAQLLKEMEELYTLYTGESGLAGAGGEATPPPEAPQPSGEGVGGVLGRIFSDLPGFGAVPSAPATGTAAEAGIRSPVREAVGRELNRTQTIGTDPTGKPITQADVDETARIYGVSSEQVIQQLIQNGATINGRSVQ